MFLSHEGKFDGEKVLRKYSRLPAAQIEFVPEATVETIRDINRGVLFLVAFWSGPSMQAFATLTEELSRLEFGSCRFVAADVDGADELRQLPEIGNSLMNGDGKTLWIRGGKIISASTPLNGRWDQHELRRLLVKITGD